MLVVRNRWAFTDKGPGSLLQPRCGIDCPRTIIATGMNLIMVKTVFMGMLMSTVNNTWTLQMDEV